MNEDSFWNIIGEAFSGGGREDQLEAYEARLQELPPGQIVEFQRVLISVMARA